MGTIVFKIKSTAVLQSLFVAPQDHLDEGRHIDLVPDEVGRVGEIDLPPGVFVYMLVLRGGQPGSAWGMTIQREGKSSVPRSGTLNEDGDGGDVGVLTIL